MATPSLTAVTSVKPIDTLKSVQLAAGQTTIYTVGANSAAKLDPLTIKNAGSAAITVKVSVVPSGGSVDGTHEVGPTIAALAVGDSATFDEVKGWYGAGVFVSVNSSAATSADVKLTGLEFS